MLIESIIYDKKLKVYVVTIKNQEPFYIVEDTLFYFNLYEGKKLETITVEELLEKNSFFTALAPAYKFLKNMKTTKELELKLRSLNIPHDIILKVIEHMEEKNLLDDLNYATLYVVDKVNINKFGKIKIKQNLIQKGIANSIIELALAGIDSEKELENAIYFAEKKFNTLNPQEKNKEAKLINHLLYKGYEYSTIKSALKELSL